MYRTDIASALNARLASLTPEMPICWENIDFTPPSSDAAVLPQITLFSFSPRTPAADDVYTITLDGVDHTASGATLAAVLQSLASSIVGGVYVASPPGVRVTGTSDGAVFTSASSVVDRNGVPISGALPSPAIVDTQDAYISNAWLEVHQLTGEPTQGSLGSDGLNKHVGIYQIDVRYPILEGRGPAKAKAADLCRLFKRGTTLTFGDATVTISKVADGPGGVENGEWYKVVVSAYYYSYTPNDD